MSLIQSIVFTHVFKKLCRIKARTAMSRGKDYLPECRQPTDNWISLLHNINIGGPPLQMERGKEMCKVCAFTHNEPEQTHPDKCSSSTCCRIRWDSCQTASISIWVHSNWRSTLPPLAWFDRYCSITTPVLNNAPARQYSVCNYNTCCCHIVILNSLHKSERSIRT